MQALSQVKETAVASGVPPDRPNHEDPLRDSQRGAPPCPLWPACPPRGAPGPWLTDTCPPSLRLHSRGMPEARLSRAAPWIRPWWRLSLGTPPSRNGKSGCWLFSTRPVCGVFSGRVGPTAPQLRPPGPMTPVCVCHAQTSHGPAPAASPDARGA